MEPSEQAMSAPGSDDENTAVSEKATAARERRLKASLEASKRKGVLYISRVPPHMKPLKLRHMLSKYGELGRLYLAPEDLGIRRKRKLMKGNTGKNFSEGWVEFLDKKIAKKVALMLNGAQMGGKRRSAYHYDLWNLKYLPKFKWDHLTEEITYQNAVREQKMATEISAAKRERDFYMTQVDRAKAETAKAERRAKRAQEDPPPEKTVVAGQHPQQKSESSQRPCARPQKRLRTYGQRQAKQDATYEAHAPELARDVLKLLGGSR